MTKNEAYLYAKSVRRLNLTKQALENRMFSAGYSPEDVRMVRGWLSHGRVGV